LGSSQVNGLNLVPEPPAINTARSCISFLGVRG
jgi:hypothetical protein